jgi:hypothetical protein
LRTAFQKRNGEEVGGPWLATPGYILGEVRRLNGEMDSFNQDMINSLKLLWTNWTGSLSTEDREALKARHGMSDADLADGSYYGAFRFHPESFGFPLYQFFSTIWYKVWRGWKDFYDDHNEWHENMWGSTVDALEAWRAQLVAMRDASRKFETVTTPDGEEVPGFTIDSPEPTEGPDWAGSGFLSGMSSLLKTLAVGGAVVLGSILGLQLLNRGGGGGGSSYRELPEARPRKSKAESQADRVAERIKEKSK